MEKSPEVLKFELSENALKLEMEERNILTCRSCQSWQSAGDMASVLNHCKTCNTKEARSDIKSLITRFSEKKGIPYNEAWDIAKAFLDKKSEEFRGKGKTYYDEDYFYTDLTNFYNE